MLSEFQVVTAGSERCNMFLESGVKLLTGPSDTSVQAIHSCDLVYASNMNGSICLFFVPDQDVLDLVYWFCIQILFWFLVML